MAKGVSREEQASDPLSAMAVIDRLKEVTHCAHDTALADRLGTARQNVTKWRSRASVPYEEAVRVSIETGVSLDYLLTGRGGNEAIAAPMFETEFIRGSLNLLVKVGVLELPKTKIRDELLDNAARIIAHHYEIATKSMREFMKRRKMSEEDARQAALVVIEVAVEKHPLRPHDFEFK